MNKALESLRTMEKRGVYKKSFGSYGWENKKLYLVDSINDVLYVDIVVFTAKKTASHVIRLTARQMLLLEKVMGFKMVDGKMLAYDDKTLQELYYQGHPGYESLQQQVMDAEKKLLHDTYNSLSAKGILNPVEHGLPMDIVYYFINNQKLVFHCNNLERDVACGCLGVYHGSDRLLSDEQLEEVFGLDDYDTLLLTLIEKFSRSFDSSTWILNRFYRSEKGHDSEESYTFSSLSDAIKAYRQWFDRDMEECRWYMSDISCARAEIVFKESLVDYLSKVTDNVPYYALKGNKAGSFYRIGVEFGVGRSQVFGTYETPVSSKDDEEEDKPSSEVSDKPMLCLDLYRKKKGLR